MSQHRRASSAVRVNEALPCAVPSCTQHRYSLSRWCCAHAAAAERNGDPIAHSIKSTNWAPYRSLIRLVYNQNAQHPGLCRALSWLTAWMEQALADDGRQPWASEVSRLHRHGCTPLDLLVELAAVWCWLQQHPHATRSDAHRAFTTSKAILGLAPRPRQVSTRPGTPKATGYAIRAKPAALRHIGPHLVGTLGPLLVTTLAAIQTEGERARREVDAMRVPFSTTTEALTRAATE